MPTKDRINAYGLGLGASWRISHHHVETVSEPTRNFKRTTSSANARKVAIVPPVMDSNIPQQELETFTRSSRKNALVRKLRMATSMRS